MKKLRGIGFVMLLLIIHASLIGCVPSNVRIQTVDRQFVSPQGTNLVAGLREIKDNRPESEKENEQYYEKPSQTTINEYLYKNLKLSGIFQNVLLGKFDDANVDVILAPNVDHFFYERKANGWTVFNLLFAFTGFPSLIYQLAGGPNGEHYAEANLKLEMTTADGKVLGSGSGEKVVSTASNLHNSQSEGLGILEGKALSDATYNTLLSLTTNIDLDKLPKPKLAKASICGSDKDCKGDRICVSGMCVNP